MSENKITWDARYTKMDVTPLELYMRQNGLCWLEIEKEGENFVLYCTDGKDKAQTACMLNPTFECAQCMSNFTTGIVSDQLRKSKKSDGDAPG